MNGWPELDRLLRTDPRDAGCAQAKELLHAYVELAADPAAAGQRYRAAARLPGRQRHAGRRGRPGRLAVSR